MSDRSPKALASSKNIRKRGKNTVKG